MNYEKIYKLAKAFEKSANESGMDYKQIALKKYNQAKKVFFMLLPNYIKQVDLKVEASMGREGVVLEYPGARVVLTTNGDPSVTEEQIKQMFMSKFNSSPVAHIPIEVVFE